MIAKTKISPPARRICDSRIDYAKMKYEVNEGSQPLGESNGIHPAASVDQREAPSRADGNHAHPVISDEETRTPKTSVGKESATMTADDWKALGFVFEGGSNKTLQIDMAKYQTMFDDAGLSDDQKEEIILELWKIIMPFVDLGFKVSPLDLACGKLAQSTDVIGNQDSAMLKSDKPNLSETFNQFAAE